MPCYKPIQIKNPERGSVLSKITVPCGRCIGCRLERSRQWAVRCVHESQMHERNCYVTLTYENQNLTYPDDVNINPTLNPRDLQLFFKRLRKKYGAGIRFFACGEYGSRNYRPHYHACIFGLDFQDKKPHSIQKGNQLYTSASLNSIWGLGHCLIGDVTFESAAYVARYICEKHLGNESVYYLEQNILPEFVRMSRRPGIGHSWLNKYLSDVYPCDNVVIRGEKMSAPRYYTNQLEKLDPETHKLVKKQRKIYAYKKYDENTPEKMLIREVIKKAQIKTLTRTL